MEQILSIPSLAETINIETANSQEYALGVAQVLCNHLWGRVGVGEMITFDYEGEGGSSPNDYVIFEQLIYTFCL